MIDLNRAKEIIKHMSDSAKEFLFQARAGIPMAEAHKSTLKSLEQDGPVRVANFENVRATNSIQGILTTEDGDKILQTIEQETPVVTENVVLTEDGNERVEKHTDVVDPSPDAQTNDKPVQDSTQATSGEDPVKTSSLEKTDTNNFAPKEDDSAGAVEGGTTSDGAVAINRKRK